MLANVVVVIILQHIHVSNQSVVHLEISGYASKTAYWRNPCGLNWPCNLWFKSRRLWDEKGCYWSFHWNKNKPGLSQGNQDACNFMLNVMRLSFSSNEVPAHSRYLVNDTIISVYLHSLINNEPPGVKRSGFNYFYTSVELHFHNAWKLFGGGWTVKHMTPVTTCREGVPLYGV